MQHTQMHPLILSTDTKNYTLSAHEYMHAMTCSHRHVHPCTQLPCGTCKGEEPRPGEEGMTMV